MGLKDQSEYNLLYLWSYEQLNSELNPVLLPKHTIVTEIKLFYF